MSIAAGLAPRAVAAPVARRRPALALVQVGVTAAPRAPFAAAIALLLVAGLLGLLVLNTVLAKDAFRMHQLQIEARKLSDTEQLLTREVEAQRASAALAERAASLGMVPAGPPTFLRLTDRTVLGAALPATAPVAEGEPAPAPAPPVTAPGDAAADPETAADATAGQGDEPPGAGGDTTETPENG